jgi:arylsulfatase
MSDGAGVFIGAPAVVAQFLATFKDYPPSQRPSSFSIDQMVEKLQKQFDAVQSR